MKASTGRLLRGVLRVLGLAVMATQVVDLGVLRGDGSLMGRLAVFIVGLGLLAAPWTALVSVAEVALAIGLPLGLGVAGATAWAAHLGPGDGAVAGFMTGAALGLALLLARLPQRLLAPLKRLAEDERPAPREPDGGPH